MKNITILPADTYTVINKTILNPNDNKTISMLYQPIIGYTATILYYTLLNDLDKLEIMSDDLTHHHLMATMQLKLEDIIEARKRLEAIGLLKTYIKEENVNRYIYLIYSPIPPHDFFNNPILNVVLYNNLGKKEYDKLINYYKIPRINLKEYKEITTPFDEVFQSNPGNPVEIDNIAKHESNKFTLSKEVDWNTLISGIPNSMLNDKCFNESTKELINSLSFIYNLKLKDITTLVRNSLNEKGLIDKDELRKKARSYYMFENNSNLPTLIYNKQPEYLKEPTGDKSKKARLIEMFESLSPYEFLKAKYKGGEPTERDKKLIEGLLIDQKLSSGVVNVLIAYTLNTKDNKLNKAFVETLAGEWKRLGIATVEEALEKTTKEKNKKQKTFIKPKKTDSQALPSWFGKEVESNIDEKEQDELANLLSSITK